MLGFTSDLLYLSCILYLTYDLYIIILYSYDVLGSYYVCIIVLVDVSREAAMNV